MGAPARISGAAKAGGGSKETADGRRGEAADRVDCDTATEEEKEEVVPLVIMTVSSVPTFKLSSDITHVSSPVFLPVAEDPK
jgi:hypothetical protein